MSELQRPALIETANVRKAKATVGNTVKNNGFTAIVAEIGSGKTHLFNHFTEFWDSKPEKFHVVSMKAFHCQQSRVPNIMKMIIRELEPDRHVPGDLEGRYKMLSECLRNAYRYNKKVILIVDESQDFSLQSFRDLKKIHEIDGYGMAHLFSIVLFGKPSYRWEDIGRMHELGYRINRITFERLSNEEVILLAEKRFGLKFSNTKVKERFCSLLTHKLPLFVENAANVFKKLPGYGGIIDESLMIEFSTIGQKMRVQSVGKKVNDVTERVTEMFPDFKRARQNVSEYMNGKLDPESEAGQMIQSAIDDIVSSTLAANG